MNSSDNNRRLYYQNYINNMCATNSYYDRVFKNAVQLQLPINRNIGFIEVFVFTERGEFPIPGALITIYANQENRSIPVFNTTSESFPIAISLPVAHPLGTLIRGPEYYFTTYDITVEAKNFAPYRCNNIRLFEGITTKFNVDMLRTVPGQYPLPENVVNIPAHPRDEIV